MVVYSIENQRLTNFDADSLVSENGGYE